MRWLAVLMMMAAGPRAALGDKVAVVEDVGEPVPTRVTGRLAGTSIELTARYELATDGMYESQLQLTLPDEAIVTHAVATVDGKRHAFSLLDATEAEKAMEPFWSDDSPLGNHRWGIRMTGGRGFALLDIAPASASKIVFDLTVEIAGCFHHDRRYALLPKTWGPQFSGARSHGDDALAAQCAIGGFIDDDPEWVSFAAPVLAKRPPGDARIGAFAGRLPLGHEDIARVEIDLASELTRVPPDLHTAIVIDHSRSLSGDEVETERAVVASYMQHVPAQSRVQVIAFARHATPVLAAWLPAASARARIDREIRALAPRNGSNVDEAIAEAGRWLSRVKGTRRLIVIGDSRLPTHVEAMTGAELKALLPENTLVHVVVVSAGTTGMQSTDRAELGGLADLTGGVAVGAGLDDSAHPSVDASMLVRPLGLDDVVIKGRGWEDMGRSTCPAEGTSLGEGESCVWWAKGSSIASAITVEAFLWGHKVTRTLLPDTTSARHLARELSASDETFDEDLHNRIDRAAFAVNTAWSLLATWGGAAGRNEEGGFGFGRSGFGPGCCGDSVARDTIGFTSAIVRKLDFNAQVAPIVKKCDAKSRLSIYLHTSREEIDEVRVTTTEPAAVQTCIEEGLWDLALAIPNAPWQASTTLQFD